MKLVSGVKEQNSYMRGLEYHSKLLDLIEHSEQELKKVIPGFIKSNNHKYRIIREPQLKDCSPGVTQVHNAHSPDFIIIHYFGKEIRMLFLEAKSREKGNPQTTYRERENLDTYLRVLKHYTEHCMEDLIDSLVKYEVPRQVIEKAKFEFRGMYRKGKHLEVYIPEFAR